MKHSRKWITVFRRLLLASACLATAIALVIVVENWRGDRAWASVQRELRAQDERLDFAAFQPTPVPADQNFLNAPLLAPILYERPDDPERAKILASTRLASFHVLGAFRGSLKDFAALRERMQRIRLLSAPFTDAPAADVLEAMRPLFPLLDELRDAARRRPRAALEPRATPLGPPQVAADTIYQLAQALAVRAAAEIELGRFNDASADIFALQRLGNALAEQPATLLNLLMGVSMQGLAAGATADGYRRHAWTEAQLLQFESQLAALRPLANFRAALRSERAQFIYVLDSRPAIDLRNLAWPPWLFHGWVQQNKVTYCRRLETEVLSLFSVDPERIFRTQETQPQPSSPRRPGFFSPYETLAHVAADNLAEILDGLGNSIDRLKLAATMSAIERHRLAHGRVPDRIDELVPTFLAAIPQGVFDGQPLRYRKLTPAGHALYTFGKNGRDDGGNGDDIVVSSAESSE